MTSMKIASNLNPLKPVRLRLKRPVKPAEPGGPVSIVGAAIGVDVTGQHTLETEWIWTFSDWYIKSLKLASV